MTNTSSERNCLDSQKVEQEQPKDIAAGTDMGKNEMGGGEKRVRTGPEGWDWR